MSPAVIAETSQATTLKALGDAGPKPDAREPVRPELSIIIVSFNTRELLRECITSALQLSAPFSSELFVVDNASRDGSAEMVAETFPQVRLLRTTENVGFGRANNLALEQACGRYLVLLNSDAFLHEDALQRAIAHMDANPGCAAGGARLISRDGSPQPSARMFHTVLGDAIVLSGLAYRYPRSRFFGRLDRTWSDLTQPASVDWIPGAFAILRPEALQRVGNFDPAFFLYYEEVDLCRRLKNAGYEVCYWPDIVVTHIGGESSRQLKTLEFSSIAAQVVLWRMRSSLLYYRRHHGSRAWAARRMEQLLYTASWLRNLASRSEERQRRAVHFRALIRLMNQAWRDTNGGRISPPQPW
ncbi:hypothetical protein SAMN05421819_3302 [Bryocella elongata]|uniref:Glycosyltransferase 2-like domain-containing protein n=1 Tax=Bryocella elongata TaxID=863522 RepID=A0A1H6AW51_9BACT|nr:glycosyltransferase family 2 protein [Bryocella elongata]SEG52524.1 hypothetical protein SAMN05421819_3302 [Bryocella elongata]